ncbi:hypothetical protein PENSPDRAFT_281568 [Peniophora sp. CONT]|nr:hypothetical protein PENSPDRAFT_281568 [Peniophora sp. CONT]
MSSWAPPSEISSFGDGQAHAAPVRLHSCYRLPPNVPALGLFTWHRWVDGSSWTMRASSKPELCASTRSPSSPGASSTALSIDIDEEVWGWPPHLEPRCCAGCCRGLPETAMAFAAPGCLHSCDMRTSTFNAPPLDLFRLYNLYLPSLLHIPVRRRHWCQMR